MLTVSVTSKGQVTIPKRVRQALGIKTGTKVEFALATNEARLKVARKRVQSKVEEGAGMLKYRGPHVSLADLDVAMLLRRKK
ncbi:MAG: AbrB/MazE/SpoVT family DNA-binding domain-containing protein [Steroidobacter sp.]